MARPGRRDLLLVALASAAGCADAIGYLGLGGVLTANMTGNTVLLGIALAQGEELAELRAACALAGFCLGVALAAPLVGAPRPALAWPRRVTLALALEALVLAGVTLAWRTYGADGDQVYALIGATSVAMGAQSAAVRSLGVPGVTTTYITGTITSLVARVAGRAGHPARAPDNAPRVALLTTVWVVYLGAAVAGAAAEMRWGADAGWLAVGAVGLVVVAAVVAHLVAWWRSRTSTSTPAGEGGVF